MTDKSKLILHIYYATYRNFGTLFNYCCFILRESSKDVEKPKIDLLELEEKNQKIEKEVRGQ